MGRYRNNLCSGFIFLTIWLGQSVAAQTQILCTAQEQWTFSEDIGRSASWAFNVSIEAQNGQISYFNVGGLDCTELTEVYVNDENIGFKCTLRALNSGSEPPIFSTNISRLSGDFFIVSEYRRSSHLNGMIIGNCRGGNRRF